MVRLFALASILAVGLSPSGRGRRRYVDRTEICRFCEARCWVEVELRQLAADRPAGLARIEIAVDGVVVGDLDWRACLRCGVAVIEQVRVDPGYRGRDLARQAVLAVRERAPSCTWSTTAVSAEAKAFWAGLGDWVNTTATRRCQHMADDLDLPD